MALLLQADPASALFHAEVGDLKCGEGDEDDGTTGSWKRSPAVSTVAPSTVDTGFASDDEPSIDDEDEDAEEFKLSGFETLMDSRRVGNPVVEWHAVSHRLAGVFRVLDEDDESSLDLPAAEHEDEISLEAWQEVARRLSSKLQQFQEMEDEDTL